MLPLALDQALRPLSGQRLLVGLSGGLDSTVLLHALASDPQLRAGGLRAIHVHHGLHPDADQWARHCAQLCASLAVELVLEHVQVARDSGTGLEASARAARYAGFERRLAPGECLVLAHHRDDQAETVLLRLLRASASGGLAAMMPSRDFAGGLLLRPLLETPRTQLLDYARAQGLEWMEDTSNLDESMDRNFLRLRVLPLLRERWPQADAALARSAALLADDARLLREGARQRLETLRQHDATTLSVAALLQLEPAWRTRVLREWLSALRVPALPGDAFAIIDSDLLNASPDAAAQYRWAGMVLRRWRDQLHVETQRDALASDWSCNWHGRGSLLLPTGDSLLFENDVPADDVLPGSAAELAEAVNDSFHGFVVHARHGGERIGLPGRTHSSTLKNLLQETDVPPWQRERIPLLQSEDGELLAAGDRIISGRLEQFCRKHSVRLHWHQGYGSPGI